MTTARRFLGGIIDYAGLFPPAALSMADAVSAYAAYRQGADRDLLGRFILPASRLNEFSSATEWLSANDDSGLWRLSVIVAPGNEEHQDQISQFNERHRGGTLGVRAEIDVVEMPVKNVDEVQSAADAYTESFALFLEPARLDESSDILTAIASTGAAAKIRTGGVVVGSIPPATAVIRFIDRCAGLGLRFKATAGLHHALRGSYPLTYEADAPANAMFGYLNVFLAAAFHRAGLPEPALFDLLEEADPSSISFDENGAWWRGNVASTEQLQSTRESFAVSFGSCSFTEPVEEAKQLHFI